MRIEAIALRALEYKELRTPQGFEPLPEEPHLDVHLEVQGAISIFEMQHAEFMLTVTATPDAARRPLVVSARMSVLLSYAAGAAPEVILQWVNRFGVLVLYPYVREVISNVTARGVFGAIFLEPIAVDALQAAATRSMVQPPSE